MIDDTKQSEANSANAAGDAAMRPIRFQFTVKKLMIFMAIAAVAAAGLRAWRRQVYCQGWANVWALNAELMRGEAMAEWDAHHGDRARACENDAAEYTELKHAYERAAYRFWEPIPTEAPLPAELR
jgi:hypothetical protein